MAIAGSLDRCGCRNQISLLLLLLLLLLVQFSPSSEHNTPLTDTPPPTKNICTSFQLPCRSSGKETPFDQTYRIGAIRQPPAAASPLQDRLTVVDLISPPPKLLPPTPVSVSRIRSGPAAVVLSGAFCLDVGWLLYLRRPTHHLPRKAFCQPPKSRRSRCRRSRRAGSPKPLPIGKTASCLRSIPLPGEYQ